MALPAARTLVRIDLNVPADCKIFPQKLLRPWAKHEGSEELASRQVVLISNGEPRVFSWNTNALSCSVFRVSPLE